MGPFFDRIKWDGRDARKIKISHVWESLHHRVLRCLGMMQFGIVLKLIGNAHHQWLLCHGRLSTLARLARFCLQVLQQCYLCIGATARETDNHLFLHCYYSRFVLAKLLSVLGLYVQRESWLDLQYYLMGIQDIAKRRIALLVAQVYSYHIWRECNTRAYDKGCFL